MKILLIFLLKESFTEHFPNWNSADQNLIIGLNA